MFEAFTRPAIDSFNQAIKEAHNFGFLEMSNHDILLAILVTVPSRNPFISILNKYNITESNVRKLILKKVPYEKKGIRKPQVPLGEVKFSLECQQLVNECYAVSNNFRHEYVSIAHIILAIIQPSQVNTYAYQIVDDLLEELPYIVDLNMLREDITDKIRAEDEEMASYNISDIISSEDLLDGQFEKTRKEQFKQFKALIAKTKAKANSKALNTYTINLSKQANNKLFDPIIGRDVEIQRIMNILLRFRKNNPLLLGEPGVGKTAVIEGLTYALNNDYIPKRLSEFEFLELDLSSLLAGSKFRGEFEERFKNLIEAFKNFDTLVLVIDEIHMLMGAGLTEGGGSDAAGILKPAIARGELKCIGATTNAEYRKVFQKDVGFDRLFQPVTIPEPTKEETIKILEGLRSRYEKHHSLKIEQSALVAAVNLSSQFINDRFLPDKALDLIDEGCSRARMIGVTIPYLSESLRNEFQLTLLMKQWAIEDQDFKKAQLYRAFEMEVRALGSVFLDNFIEGKDDRILQIILVPDTIADVVTAWTGIPMVKAGISKDETARLLKMEESLQKRVIGQKVAIAAISKAVRRARVGLKSPNRPIASFIFAGPTGVGKTELAKTLSNFFFGSDDSMVRLDMSEYMERHNVSKLIGSPPGYVGYEEGGFLTEKVKSKPYSVVLFDEIEKAHPDVFNLLLQILEDGRLSDSQSRLIDFKNTFIILTSNIGSSALQEKTAQLSKRSGITDQFMYDELSKIVNIELKKHFRPEFLNRLDEIIIFQQLTLPEVRKITEIILTQLIERVSKNSKFTIKIEDSVKEKLASDGFDPLYGARPLRRVITNLVENKLATLFLERTYPENASLTIYIDKLYDKNEICIRMSDDQPSKKENEVKEFKEPIQLEFFEIQREYKKTVIDLYMSSNAFEAKRRAGLNPPGKAIYEMGQVKSREDRLRLHEGLESGRISPSDYVYMKAKDMTIDELEAYIDMKNAAFKRAQDDEIEEELKRKKGFIEDFFKDFT
jgi:ATP-dependent Clp protease ATP-binding subunit ClpC